jgi:hypothetical protein
MNLAEIREKHRLQLLEEKLLDCIDERSQISRALSECSDNNRREHYELRAQELGLEIAVLWIEYRKLAKAGQTSLDEYEF